MEQVTLQIRTLSPLHIRAGSAGKDYGYGQISDQARNIYTVDTAKLRKYVVQTYGIEKATALAEQMTADILAKNTRNKRGNHLYQTLRELNISLPSDMAEVAAARIGKRYHNNEAQFMTNGLNQPFLPGSSLKGMFRTGLVNALFQSKPPQEQQQIIDTGIQNAKKTRRTKQASLSMDLFEEAMIASVRWSADQKQRRHEPTGPFRDIFKVIKVSDSDTLPSANGQSSQKQSAPSVKLDFGQFYTGQIKTIISDKGFGFITVPGVEDDIYFNFRDAEEPHSLREGLWVDFQLSTGRKGPAAQHVEESFEIPDVAQAETSSEMPERVSMRTADRFSLSGDAMQPKGFNQSLECFTGETRVTLTLDTHLLEKAASDIPFHSLDEFLAKSQRHYHEIWKYEQEFAREYLQNTPIEAFYNQTHEQLGRLGFGMGVLTDTILLHASPEQRKTIREITAGHKRNQDMPKSKWFITSGAANPIYPLGWITYQVISS